MISNLYTMVFITKAVQEKSNTLPDVPPPPVKPQLRLVIFQSRT